jgi:integrase
MKGFMRRRGEAWELRVFLGADPVTGKKRYVSKTVRGGKREAQRTLAEMITDAERGLTVRTSATVGELLEQWFELASRDFSPKTVKETRGFMDRNLLPYLATVPLAKLRASDVDALYQRLLARGGKGGRPLKPATVRRIHVILRRALGQGVKWGWIGANPAAAATPPKVLDPDINPPSGGELGRVLQRAFDEQPELACSLLLAAATGARRSEVIALRWADVDLEARTVWIHRGVVVGVDGLVEKDTKTHSARRVSLDARTAAVVVDHYDRMRHRAEVCRTEVRADSFVFSNEADFSQSWYPDTVSRSFKRLCRREGMPDVRLHDLRHFVATQLFGAGVDARTIAGRLGHRNAATTLNVYAHFLQSADRGAADIIGSVIEFPTGEAS